MKFKNRVQGYSTYDENYSSIICHFCFEKFEVHLEVSKTSYGTISEIYDCVVCCNPNKIEYEILNENIHVISVSNGNE